MLLNNRARDLLVVAPHNCCIVQTGWQWRSNPGLHCPSLQNGNIGGFAQRLSGI